MKDLRYTPVNQANRQRATQIQIQSIYHQMKRYMYRFITIKHYKYNYAVRYCTDALLKAGTTYTLYGNLRKLHKSKYYVIYAQMQY